MESLESKVSNHEVEITYIKKALDEIVEQNKKQNLQLEQISVSIQQQGVILEKISNLEEKYQESTKRVHKRIDEETIHFKDRIEQIEHRCEECCSRPCINHNENLKEIEFLKEKVANHSKYFWFVNSAILGAIIMALIGLILKK